MAYRFLFLLLVAIALCTGCSDDSVAPIAPPPTLTLLVTNDDGIAAPGIDTLVNALVAMDDVDVKVVAPAENQSGSSDRTTDGKLEREDSATVSGYQSVAVFGFPADAVNVALNELAIKPDLVVSGVNAGQNVGPFAALSGTVGAARTAARAGVPAVAVSAGLVPATQDFGAAAALVVDWITSNRSALLSGIASASTVTSFNVPGCTAGNMRELVQVPLGNALPTGGPGAIFATDCSAEPDAPPTSDVDAMVKGYASVTQVPLNF
ncbi:MAG: 5'/3'-nucleotidase SurE [Pseudomonadota bacterium]